MKRGLPIYHVDRVVKETDELFGDGAHIIYVNSQIKDETKLGRLMHDFSCTDADDMYNKLLANRVRYFKEDKEGVAIMCREMEKMRNDAHAEGCAETLIQTIDALMQNLKLNIEDACKAAGITLEAYMSAKALLIK